VWAVASGRVPAGTTEVPIDVPSGRVVAQVHPGGEVSFRNVASYVLARDVPVVTERGPVRVDVSYGGAIYASVAASSLGLAVTPENYVDLIAVGREIKWALNETEWAHQRGDTRLDGVYATILYDDLGSTADGPHQRNVAVFADGQVDRSPCGSGTSARMALLAADGRLTEGQVLVHDSIIGTRFTGRLVGAGPDGVVTEITGSAFVTGESVFRLDPADSLGTGFTLR
jgi:proline racemase